MKINIIVRGYLYREGWSPNTTAKKDHPLYIQDFTQLIDAYKKLFNGLAKKNEISVTFTSYDITPTRIKDIIISNKWNLYLAEEVKSPLQFTTCCSYLETLNDNHMNLIIRSDLIIKDKLIELLCDLNYETCEKLLVLQKEPNGQPNDVLFVVPPTFRKKLCSIIGHRAMGHYLGPIPVSCMVNEEWNVTEENDYYQIYRGN